MPLSFYKYLVSITDKGKGVYERKEKREEFPHGIFTRNNKTIRFHTMVAAVLKQGEAND